MALSSQEVPLMDLEAVRTRYKELLAKLVEQRVPGVIDLVGLTCNCGESCHGGSPDRPIESLEQLVLPRVK